MTGIDRHRVQRAFDAHADDYETYARVQKQVVERFTSRLERETIRPAAILDIGVGTGRLLRSLATVFPEARLAGIDLSVRMGQAARANLAGRPALLVAGDGEMLPFADASFDLVVSTSTFQWLESLDEAFGEVTRVLAPGGVFAFTLFGERTLYELRTSYRKACQALGRGEERRTHTFFPAAAVAAALDRSGLLECAVATEMELESHPDVPALLRSIRRIGAGNAAPERSVTLAERRVMLTMMEIYRRDHAGDGVIPATYEVIYGAGRKAAG
jgi:malonyl-CoA O-methyltransferase